MFVIIMYCTFILTGLRNAFISTQCTLFQHHLYPLPVLKSFHIQNSLFRPNDVNIFECNKLASNLNFLVGE